MAVKKFIYDGDTVLQVTDGAGVTLTEYTSTADGYGDLLSTFDGTSTKYYEPDGLGSTDALTDNAQAVVDRWKYRAFGTATQTVGSDANPFTWVGRHGYYSDSETGLSLLRARYFDPVTTQFLSQDPTGLTVRDANLYRYSANDPVNHVDPSGLVQVKFLGPVDVACGKKPYARWDFTLDKAAPELPVGTGYYIVQRNLIYYSRSKCPCKTSELHDPIKVVELFEAWYVPQGSKVSAAQATDPPPIEKADETDRSTGVAIVGTCGIEIVRGQIRVFELSGDERPDHDPAWGYDKKYPFRAFPDRAAAAGRLLSTGVQPKWWNDSSAKFRLSTTQVGK